MIVFIPPGLDEDVLVVVEPNDTNQYKALARLVCYDNGGHGDIYDMIDSRTYESIGLDVKFWMPSPKINCE